MGGLTVEELVVACTSGVDTAGCSLGLDSSALRLVSNREMSYLLCGQAAAGLGCRWSGMHAMVWLVVRDRAEGCLYRWMLGWRPEPSGLLGDEVLPLPRAAA